MNPQVLRLVGGVFLLHALLAVAVPSPYIFIDELIYVKLARCLAWGQPLVLRGEPVNFPTLLYPLLLAPTAWLPATEWGYLAAQLVNAALLASAALPLYLLGTRLLPPRAAWWTAALASVLPFTLFGNTAMSENLFYPLVLWTALAFVAATAPGASWQVRAGLGLAMGLAFHTKPHGMVLLPVVVCLAALACRRLPGLWPAALVWLAFAGLHVVRVVGPKFDLAALLGTYGPAFGAIRPFDPLFALQAALGLLGVIATAVGFLPVGLWAWWAWRAAPGSSDRALAWFTACLGLVFVAATVRHTVLLDNPLRIHERYVFYVEPLILLGAARAALAGGFPWPRPAIAIAAVAAAIGVGLAGNALRTFPASDAPAYLALMPFYKVLGMPAALVMGAGVAVGLLLLLVRARSAGRAGAILAVYVGGFTGLAAFSQAYTSRTYAALLPASHWLSQVAPPGRALAFAGNPDLAKPFLVLEFFARQDVRRFYFDAPAEGWHEQPIAALDALPPGTLILAPRSRALPYPVVATHGDLALHRKAGS